MLSNRLLMAASWYGRINTYTLLLYMGVWQVAELPEPPPLPKEQTLAPFSFNDISFGIIRTLGLIGEWYVHPPKEQTLAPFSFNDISTGVIRTIGSIGEWYVYPPKEQTLAPFSFNDISFGIIRTIGSIGEWYVHPNIQYKPLPYPGYSYMDIVLSEL